VVGVSGGVVVDTDVVTVVLEPREVLVAFGDVVVEREAGSPVQAVPKTMTARPALPISLIAARRVTCRTVSIPL
jgi:hypothetical protein